MSKREHCGIPAVRKDNDSNNNLDIILVEDSLLDD